MLPPGRTHTVTKLKRKAALAENAIRKLRSKIEKAKTFSGRKDVWPRLRNDILKSLNSTPLTNLKIDISPNDVTLSNAGKVFEAKFGDYIRDVETKVQTHVYQIGDAVRLTLDLGPFRKGSLCLTLPYLYMDY